jgi:putative hydrolase of the HAD superfamily
VPRIRACLLDAYQTIVTVDFTAHENEIPALAGVPAGIFYGEFARIAPELTVGRISMAEAFGQILRACGVEPRPGLERELVERSRELLLASGRLYDDALPSLEKLKARGVMIAIVSNCDELTRDLLTKLGVAALADSLTLSCEVGAAKPAAQIFDHALDELGVTAEAAFFVDDNAGYCASAAVLGMTVAQMVRGDQDGKAPVTDIPVVRSMFEVESMIWGEAGSGCRPADGAS